MRAWAAAVWAGGLALGAGAAVAQGPPPVSPSKVDWAHLATLVTDRWQLARGERAVLLWDRTGDRGAAAALRKAIEAKGALVSGEIDAADPRDDVAWARAFEKA